LPPEASELRPKTAAGRTLRYATAHSLENNESFWKGIAAGFFAGISVAAALRYRPVEQFIQRLAAADSTGETARAEQPSKPSTVPLEAEPPHGDEHANPIPPVRNPGAWPRREPAPTPQPVAVGGFYSFRPTASPATGQRREAGSARRGLHEPTAVPAWILAATRTVADPGHETPRTEDAARHGAEVVEMPSPLGGPASGRNATAAHAGSSMSNVADPSLDRSGNRPVDPPKGERVDHIDLSQPYRAFPRYFDMGSAG
jgi:hypothetical protein